MEDLKKKISHIWYYYKVPIIIVVCVIFVIFDSIISNKDAPKYDNSIAIISKENYPSEEEVERLRKAFESKYDGSFDVVIYNIELCEPGEDEIIISKLSLDLANNISEYLFIENMDKFEEATNNLEVNIQGLGKEFEWLKNCGVDDFYYCTR